MANRETFVTNAAETTLSSSLAAGATTINVTSTSAFPAVPFYAVIDPDVNASREIILVDSAKTATTFALTAASSRGQDGTTDTSHSSGARVVCVPVAALWTDINDRVDVKANDADVVKLIGAQTISGAKTFSTDPTLADGSSALSQAEADAAYRVTSLWLPATGLGSVGGSPTLGAVAGSRSIAWLLDSATTENLSGNFSTPSHWTTFNVTCHYVNAGAGTGDVVFRTLVRSANPTETLAADDAAGNVTNVALAQDVVRSFTLLSGISRRGEFTNVRVGRLGGDAADTLGNDIGLLGISLVKAS